MTSYLLKTALSNFPTVYCLFAVYSNNNTKKSGFYFILRYNSKMENHSIDFKIVSGHPLVAEILTKLRNSSTDSETFRRLGKQITKLLLYESIAAIETEKVHVQTPLALAQGEKIKGSIIIIPILRAGLIMAEAAAEILPDASIVHMGLVRDEETLAPREYLSPNRSVTSASIGLILDPMLATGGTVAAACNSVKGWDVDRLIYVGILGSEAGVSYLQSEYPKVEIHLAAIDPHLDQNGFIVPGLGDAGDRFFCT